MNGDDSKASKLEQRWIAALTAIALLFGGWWLQNQYDTMLRVQEQLSEFSRHVDNAYVRKDYLQLVENRLGRIEDKIDDIRDAKGVGDDKK